MGQEIERKFLVANNSWQSASQVSHSIKQGYLCHEKGRTVRIRVSDTTAYLTIKGPTKGFARSEFEYAIPLKDAEEMLATMIDGHLVAKRRYLVPCEGHTWEVDLFEGDNAGLILAEIELESEEESFDLPEWIGVEVTHDRRYHNSQLSLNPFCTWKS